MEKKNPAIIKIPATIKIPIPNFKKCLLMFGTTRSPFAPIGLIIALVGIPCSIDLAFENNSLIWIILSLIQVPNLINGIVWLNMKKRRLK